MLVMIMSSTCKSRIMTAARKLESSTRSHVSATSRWIAAALADDTFKARLLINSSTSLY
jgi:hypothetical protein